MVLQAARQLPSLTDAFMGMVGPIAKGYAKRPATVEKVKPKRDNKATREIIRWGPYTLLSAGVSYICPT
jgi:hypothetical protein